MSEQREKKKRKKKKYGRKRNTVRTTRTRLRKEKRRENHTKFILGKLKPQWRGVIGHDANGKPIYGELEISNKKNVIGYG